MLFMNTHTHTACIILLALGVLSTFSDSLRSTCPKLTAASLPRKRDVEVLIFLQPGPGTAVVCPCPRKTVALKPLSCPAGWDDMPMSQFMPEIASAHLLQPGAQVRLFILERRVWDSSEPSLGLGEGEMGGCQQERPLHSPNPPFEIGVPGRNYYRH